MATLLLVGCSEPATHERNERRDHAVPTLSQHTCFVHLACRAYNSCQAHTLSSLKVFTKHNVFDLGVGGRTCVCALVIACMHILKQARHHPVHTRSPPSFRPSSICEGSGQPSCRTSPSFRAVRRCLSRLMLRASSAMNECFLRIRLVQALPL